MTHLQEGVPKDWYDLAKATLEDPNMLNEQPSLRRPATQGQSSIEWLIPQFLSLIQCYLVQEKAFPLGINKPELWFCIKTKLDKQAWRPRSCWRKDPQNHLYSWHDAKPRGAASGFYYLCADQPREEIALQWA